MYVVVGIAGIALTGCILMVIILKYGRNSKFGIKGESLQGSGTSQLRGGDGEQEEEVCLIRLCVKETFLHFFKK